MRSFGRSIERLGLCLNFKIKLDCPSSASGEAAQLKKLITAAEPKTQFIRASTPVTLSEVEVST